MSPHCCPQHNRDVRQYGRCHCSCHFPRPRMMPVLSPVEQADEALDDAIEAMRDSFLLFATRFGMAMEQLAATIRAAMPQLNEVVSQMIQAQIERDLAKLQEETDERPA